MASSPFPHRTIAFLCRQPQCTLKIGDGIKSINQSTQKLPAIDVAGKVGTGKELIITNISSLLVQVHLALIQLAPGQLSANYTSPVKTAMKSKQKRVPFKQGVVRLAALR